MHGYTAFSMCSMHNRNVHVHAYAVRLWPHVELMSALRAVGGKLHVARNKRPEGGRWASISVIQAYNLLKTDSHGGSCVTNVITVRRLSVYRLAFRWRARAIGASAPRAR